MELGDWIRLNGQTLILVPLLVTLAGGVLVAGLLRLFKRLELKVSSGARSRQQKINERILQEAATITSMWNVMDYQNKIARLRHLAILDLGLGIFAFLPLLVLSFSSLASVLVGAAMIINGLIRFGYAIWKTWKAERIAIVLDAALRMLRLSDKPARRKISRQKNSSQTAP